MTALDRTRLTGSLVSHARPAFWRGGRGILRAYKAGSVEQKRGPHKKTQYFCGERRDNEAKMPLPLAGRATSRVCGDEAALDRTREICTLSGSRVIIKLCLSRAGDFGIIKVWSKQKFRRGRKSAFAKNSTRRSFPNSQRPSSPTNCCSRKIKSPSAFRAARIPCSWQNSFRSYNATANFRLSLCFSSWIPGTARKTVPASKKTPRFSACPSPSSRRTSSQACTP